MPRAPMEGGPAWDVQHSTHYVYTLRAPGSRRIRYVGVTSDPRTRWHGHVYNAKRAAKCGQTTPLYAWVLDLAAADKRPVMELVGEVGIIARDDPPYCGAAYEARMGEALSFARRAEAALIRRLQAEGAPLLNEQHMAPAQRSDARVESA